MAETTCCPPSPKMSVSLRDGLDLEFRGKGLKQLTALDLVHEEPVKLGAQLLGLRLRVEGGPSRLLDLVHEEPVKLGAKLLE